VVTDEDGNVIDGHHRVKACEELGVKYPTRVIAGFSEEQKQDLSVELNMHRRHLTKEQKKELAVNLREQGWTQERIGKALGVPQQTISRWFTHLSNPDQPSPNQPDPEIIRLKKEIEAREESEKRLEQKAERQLAEERRKHEAEALLLRQELEEAKNTPTPEPVVIEKVVEKPVVSPELEERVRRKEAKLDAAMAALKEKNKAEEAADKINRETIEEHYKLREKALQEKLAEKIKEMDAATKAGLDVSELQKQKERLQFEILNMQSDVETEAKLKRIREQFRKSGAGVSHTLAVIELLEKGIADDPVYCRLSPDELSIALNDLAHLRDASGRAIALLEQVMEKIKEGARLHVVKKVL
jgi:ParB-like chromosome segregation protein Spo0J